MDIKAIREMLIEENLGDSGWIDRNPARVISISRSDVLKLLVLAESASLAFRAGAEAMREAAIKLCESPDIAEIEEYADCIRAMPLPEYER